MELAVVEGDFEVDHRVPSQIAFCSSFLNPLFDGGDKTSRDRTTEDFVNKLEVGTTFKWFDSDSAIAELTMATSLLLVSTVSFGGCCDRLAIRNPRELEVNPHSEPSLQFGDGHFDMQLALA